MKYFLLLCLYCLLPVSFAATETQHKDQPSDVIKQILQQDIFPHQKTEERWTLDLDNDEKKDENSDSLNIPEFLILLMATISEYILWISLLILLYIAYLNRKLVNFDKLPKKNNNNNYRHNISEPDELQETISQIEKELDKSLASGNSRQVVALIYRAVLIILNQHELNIKPSMTETEVTRITSGFRNKELIQLLNQLADLRTLTAYRSLPADQNTILSVYHLWKEQSRE